MKILRSFGFIFVLIFALTSCSDSSTDSSGDTTVEEDIANIETSIDNTVDLMSDFENGTFATAAKDFTGASSGEFTSSQWIEDVFSGLGDYLDFESTSNDGRFDFNAHTGIYEYDHNSGGWTESSSQNSIVLRFPSSESSTTNDMEFIISEYEDALASISGESYYLPTRIQSSLELEGNEIFAFNLNELVYSDDPDLPIPETLDWQLVMAPLSNQLNFDRSTGTEFTFSNMVSNDDELVVGVELELEVAHDDYNNLTEEDFEQLSGSFHMTSDLRLDFDIDLGSISTLEDPSENEINALFTGNVFYNDNNIGELEYSEAEGDILIVYKDGSTESASQYMTDFAERIETVFYSFTGDWQTF